MISRQSTARGCAALALALFLAAPRVAAAVDDIFVLVDGIPGDSTEAGHPGWIRAFALGNSVANPISSGGGKATFSDLSILKNIDTASPALFVTAAGRRQLSTVTIEFVRPGVERFTYFKMLLSDALITGVRTNANSTDDSITEFVTFSYARIRWEYTPQKADGSPGPKVTGCWDVSQNLAC